MKQEFNADEIAQPKEELNTVDELKRVSKAREKISYQKAMKLQRQARESQIPEDIPVLKRLNQSVERFEKFRRQCTEYYRFRDRIKQKGASLLVQP